MIDLKKERPISVAAVAARFGVHRRTVEGWFHRGLERVKVGGRVYTTLEALQRFAEPAEYKPTPQYRAVEAALKALREKYGVKV